MTILCSESCTCIACSFAFSLCASFAFIYPDVAKPVCLEFFTFTFEFLLTQKKTGLAHSGNRFRATPCSLTTHIIQPSPVYILYLYSLPAPAGWKWSGRSLRSGPVQNLSGNNPGHSENSGAPVPGNSTGSVLLAVP